MGTNIDITSLRYFVHVATAGSFVRGAKRAHVSPPAISKAIRKLEGELGVQLFERTTRRVALTDEAQKALQQCRRILADVDSLTNTLTQDSRQPRGPLRIAAMEVFSLELLPTALADIAREHPAIVPLCYEMIPQRMTERLLDGELDVAFTIGAAPTPGIDLRALGISRGVLVCGKQHPLFRKGRVVRADLERHRSIVPKFFGAEHLPSLDQFPDERFARQIGGTFELLQMGVELVARGPFLGYFPEISVRAHLAAGRLRALRGLTGMKPFELHAMTHVGGRGLRPAVSLLIERVAAIASQFKRRG